MNERHDRQAHMTAGPAGLLRSLDDRVEGILDACTACGKCVDVCPTPAITGIDQLDAKAIAAGVLDILRDGEGPEFSHAWASKCCGSGHCLTVCPEGINPRFMLTMARRTLAQMAPEDERKETGKAAFKTMSRAVRVISRLQLPPDLMARLSPSSHPARETPPDVIFYTGCNMLKTPHIGLLCLDVLDRLDASYEVHGGPANCCGILQLRPGDTDNATRQAGKTMERFAKVGAQDVLSWCPTCQMQFSETLPSKDADAEGRGLDITMFPVYLAKRLDDLRPLMTTRVEKRVALHEYPGSPGVTESVLEILSAIPGLEIIELEMPKVGYQITSLVAAPDFMKKHIAGTLKRAEELDVTTLAGVYHADHRELTSHQNQWPFEIVNYMELIGESLGLSRPDIFKRMKLMQDADAIISDARELIETYKLDPEEVRDVVINDLLGDQHLPIDRALHPALDGD